ncbi:hypothetical protein DB347_15155 [Opitutaceae bacterium EW11]|nr:hypothetical protein DB347_15155 [Opitutaceae bacterium EW11]
MQGASPYQLIYVSTSRFPWVTPDLKTLFEENHTRNAVQGITGILIYHDRQFLQVIEGGDVPVRRLFGKIERDPRHFNVSRVWDGYLHSREYSDYTLAFDDGSEPSRHPHPTLNPFELSRWPPNHRETRSPADEFLRIFRRISKRR